MQKQTMFYETQLKKHKNYFIKTAFQTQFFNKSRSIKHSFYSYQISCCCFLHRQHKNKYKTNVIYLISIN